MACRHTRPLLVSSLTCDRASKGTLGWDTFLVSHLIPAPVLAFPMRKRLPKRNFALHALDEPPSRVHYIMVPRTILSGAVGTRFISGRMLLCRSIDRSKSARLLTVSREKTKSCVLRLLSARVGDGKFSSPGSPRHRGQGAGEGMHPQSLSKLCRVMNFFQRY